MAVPVVRWDQRAVALAELRGTATDRELWEAALAERGWPVLERRGTSVTPVTEARAWYVVEIRFPGSRFRAVTGARQRLEVLAEELHLDLVVEAVDLVVRQPDLRARWQAYERPSPRTARWTRLWRPAVSLLRWGGTGRQISAGAPTQAQALAARPLPGAAPPPAGPVVHRRSLSFRARGGRPRSHTHRGVPLAVLAALFVGLLGAREGSTVNGGIGAPALLTGFGVGIGPFLDPARLAWPGGPVVEAAVEPAWVMTVFAVVTVLVLCRLYLRNRPDWPVLLALLVGTLVYLVVRAVGFVTGSLLIHQVPWGDAALAHVDALAVNVMLVAGLGLLIRQSGWRPVVPWLLPALLPFVPGLLPAVGLSLHATYLAAFEVDLEDVDIAAVDSLAAAAAVLAAMGLWLFVPALLGFARHFHLMVRDRWMGRLFLVLVSVFCCAVGVGGLWEDATTTSFEARLNASGGYTPPPYYGIKPEWVCASPARELGKVPSEGGLLQPERPYLLLGDASGTALLWHTARVPGIPLPDDEGALKIPLASLRLVPAEDPRRPCP
ncbi:hypothetical protein DEJ50_18835 [Streptomyces venezuelae]|uniref:Uncharacterized protein n=1 Tax=Streptomyces venezuelae TaxID=54571 RepID=A0A5P2D339_STRVZ|nr:hypothetical protein [Streptomyces venezuelae]QES49555.1 hypothetical protein DEJ50_18835 [Streptomyces venezuelae]